MSAPVIEVEGLRKVFGKTVAVDALSFRLERGEILGLLGPNGAGKTTAISMLLSLVTPTAGRIRMLGREMPRERVAILERSNFSSAYVNLPSNLKVRENLIVFAKLYGVPRHRERIAELLELFEVTHLAGRVTGALSSGESTRVNLCKALLNEPELLLLDEPTASLDPDMADKVRRILRSVQREKGISMLYTSHNMRDVEEVCDRALFMHRGRLIAAGAPAEIQAQFGERSLEQVFIKVARGGDLVESGDGA